MVLDHLGQPSDAKGHRRNAERDGIDYRSAEPLRARWVQENVEPRHGIVYFVNESRAERGEAADGLGAFPLASQEYQSDPAARGLLQLVADRREHRQAFLGAHRADDPAHDRIAWPAALGAPIAPSYDPGLVYAVIDELNATAIDTTPLEGLAYGTRYGNEPGDAVTVLQASVGHEHNAPRHDERDASPPDERRQRDRVRMRVVRVDQVTVPGPQCCADPARGGNVPIAAHPHLGRGDSVGAEAADERSIRRADDQRFVSQLTLAACEEIHLALPAAPFAAGVEVQYAQRGRCRHRLSWQTRADT